MWLTADAEYCLPTFVPSCRGGTVRVTGVKYNTKQLVVQPRLAWKGAMQVIVTSNYSMI